MADYRDISQEYAQDAIKAAFTLNGGASIAILSQISNLKGNITDLVLGLVLLFWCFGVTLSTITWGLGFYLTRYVDKSERENDISGDLINTANDYMAWGFGCIFASIAAFFLGAVLLALALICG